MQVLVLKQESQSQVASHVSIGLISSLLCQPVFILKSVHLFFFKLLVLLKLKRIRPSLVFNAKLKVVAWLVLINVYV